MRLIRSFRRHLPILAGAFTLLGLVACSERDAPPGDWTFINYWAEWCKPCIKEIPELNRLNAQAGYRVLGVNFDGARGEDLDAQLAALGVAFETLERDPGADYGLERPRVLPTTLVIAPNGSLQQVLVGPQTVDSLIAVTQIAADGTPAGTPASPPAPTNG